MNEAKQGDELYTLGQRVRERIKKLAIDLDALPEELGPIAPAILAWRLCLLTLIWDISDAPLTLLRSDGDHLRASRILVRALYEYAIRLEYYSYNRIQAIKDYHNSEAWLKGVLKGGFDQADFAKWTKEERRAYNDMLKVEDKFEYQGFRTMLKGVFQGRRYSKGEIRKALRHGLHYYTICSSYVHASQGVLYDVFEPTSEFGKSKVHFRSFRLPRIQMLRDTVFYLCLTVFGESLHQHKDLGADFYWRDLDLIMGD